MKKRFYLPRRMIRLQLENGQCVVNTRRFDTQREKEEVAKQV